MTTLLHNAYLVDGNEPQRGWLLIDGAFIAAVGSGDCDLHADEVIDCNGAYLTPGAIDCHVHFREPGMTHKGSIASESRAAVLGGVTSFIDMPNVKPATTTIALWQQKSDIAQANSRANFAFMLGATADNLHELQRADFSRIPAVKVFMGASTGNLLLDDDKDLRRVFAEQPGRVVVHAEDQATLKSLATDIDIRSVRPEMLAHTLLRPAQVCVRATERAMELASQYGTRLHIAHLSTREETELFDPDSTSIRQITCEVSPHHLLFTTDDYARLGSRIKINPAIKYAGDRQALREALLSGRIDIVATDHAPHTLEEKQGDIFHAASGAPMVQFAFPVLADIFGIVVAVRRMCNNPARLYGIERRGFLKPGYYADLALIEELSTPHIISDQDVASPCGWTPLVGYPTRHRVIRTFVNGGTKPLPLTFSQP